MMADYPSLMELIKAGKLRALMTASLTREATLPDVPTVDESGYKNYDADNMSGLVAPAKTPKEKLAQLAGWFTTALGTPEVKAKLSALGLYPVGKCGADFGDHLRGKYDEYGRVIRAANIKAD